MPRLRLLPPATVVDSHEKATAVLNYLMNRGGRIAIDTETTGLDVMRDRILYWSMATEDQRYFLEYQYLYRFDPLFQRKDVSWYLANAKYDMHMFANAAVSLAGEVRDIVVMDAMIDDTRPHGLKEQNRLAYGIEWGDFKDLFLDPERVAKSLSLDKEGLKAFKALKGQEKLPFVYGNRPDIVIDYASCDAFFTFMRGEDLEKQLGATPLPSDVVDGFDSLLDYFNIIEVPLTKSLWGMERRGFRVDMGYVKKVDQPMRDGIARLEKEISDLVGRDFNPRSGDEIGEFLFKTYKIKPISYTDSGAPSTAEGDLKRVAERFANDPTSPVSRFIKMLLEHKKLTKLHGTYVKSLDKHIGPDGRVHSRLNQTGARTSRLSSSDPNMQNVPARNDPYKLRGMFVAGDGRSLVDLDYPQIEFRVAAALAGAQSMMEAIRSGWDIHSANAANAYNLPYDDIIAAVKKKDAKQALDEYEKRCVNARVGAKAIGLGTMYGEGAAKIAMTIGISKERAQEDINKFFRANPELQNLIHDTHDFAHQYGYTYTMLGRMRQLHRINSGMRGIEAEEERQAFNTLIQGSSAEMMKLAILRIDHDPRLKELGSELILTVHDELISEAPDDVCDDVREVKRELMGDPYRWGPIQIQYPVPISPDGSIAKRWSEAK